MSPLERGILVGISLVSVGMGLYGLMGALNSFGKPTGLASLLGSVAAATTGYMVNKALGSSRELKVRVR